MPEPMLAEFLMHTAPPRPFAGAISLVALAAELRFRERCDVILPRHRELRVTPAYQGAACRGHGTLDEISDRAARRLRRPCRVFSGRS